MRSGSFGPWEGRSGNGNCGTARLPARNRRETKAESRKRAIRKSYAQRSDKKPAKRTTRKKEGDGE